MARLVLDGVIVRHAVRPAEALFERSPLVFALVVFITTASWIVIGSSLSPAVRLIGTPVVIIASLLSPLWLRTRPDIEGNRRVMLDERGLQIEGILMPWRDLHVIRHGSRETATSLWSIGSETIVASFEHEDARFSAFLGVRFHPLHPFVKTEKLRRTLSEEEILRLEAVLGEYARFENTREPEAVDTGTIWRAATMPEAILDF